MTTEKRTRQKYSGELKWYAVALVTDQGYQIPEAARSLDIGGNLLRRWKLQFEEEVSSACLNSPER